MNQFLWILEDDVRYGMRTPQRQPSSCTFAWRRYGFILQMIFSISCTGLQFQTSGGRFSTTLFICLTPRIQDWRCDRRCTASDSCSLSGTCRFLRFAIDMPWTEWNTTFKGILGDNSTRRNKYNILPFLNIAARKYPGWLLNQIRR